MKKFLSYLLLMSLLIIFVSSCSNDNNDDPYEPEENLSNQLRADAGSNQVTLEWKFMPAADTYNIYYIEDDGSMEQPTSEEIQSNGTKIEGIISAPYILTGLTNGTPYWFALSAKKEGQDESDLTKAIYSIPADDPPLPAPENVRANAGDKEVTITWDTVTGAAGYRVYYFTSFAMYGQSPKTTNNYYTFSGLTNDQDYVFWVEALDSDDNSTTGDSSTSFVYPATPSINPPPLAPTNPAVIDNNNGNVTVEWDTMSGATSYNIYIAKAKGVTQLTGAVTNVVNQASTLKQAAETTLTNGTYYIVVTAVKTVDNSAGFPIDLESAESREVSITITDNP